MPGAAAFCPGCNSPVIAKCGQINVWHWAHVSNMDCDEWYEPESLWHLGWKDYFPVDNQEVVMKPHRADVRTDRGVVIELQHSHISVEEAQKREAFYKNMIWVINGNDFEERFCRMQQDGYEKFKWYHPRKTWQFTTKPVYIDFGYTLFEIRKFYSNGWGWGKKVDRKRFIESHGGTLLK